MSIREVKSQLHLNVGTENIRMERNECGVYFYRFAFESIEALNVINGNLKSEISPVKYCIL